MSEANPEGGPEYHDGREESAGCIFPWAEHRCVHAEEKDQGEDRRGPEETHHRCDRGERPERNAEKSTRGVGRKSAARNQPHADERGKKPAAEPGSRTAY